ncbi:hypothetical protein FPZ43_00555 [Mucilaginibacter pallidiroseus]|uniref:Uncharacterized protein n=1 Tax=Mucilaginibacter pallidiroseus TaxID=2599295 RepID=A0A563UI97_9SPHI|nr:hypothetical protein [Mucilaginibacter pallidiroseus]TWR31009.1 hypothetical protein FPZ43_00555 [Mucilaginibacter pallidiroseus]
MNIKLFTAAVAMTLTATAMSASAQKAYKEGVVTLSTNAMGQTIDGKNYFSPDSSAFAFSSGPAAIKLLTDNKSTFMAVLVDVPVASIKKAAIANADEIADAKAKTPTLTFTPSTESKVINGFKCTKVTGKDAASGKTYDVWITKDVSLPMNGMMQKLYGSAGGYPIQYFNFQDGKSVEVTVKSIVEQQLPKGTFSIDKDFEKISMDDLKALGGGGN